VRRTFARSAVLLALVACGGPLDRDELHGEVEDLHALAAEAHLLFERDVPRAYFRVHREMLADKVRDVAKQLARGVDDPALDTDRQSAYVLARALEPVVRAGHDPDAVLPIEHQLAAIDTRLSP
jgi:hypothetical protein